MESRIEYLLKTLLNADADSIEDFVPQSVAEHYLKNCILQTGTSGLPDPQSRLDTLLYDLAENIHGMGDGTIPQSKTVIPTRSQQTITADSGYRLTKVIVEAFTPSVEIIDNILYVK